MDALTVIGEKAKEAGKLTVSKATEAKNWLMKPAIGPVPRVVVGAGLLGLGYYLLKRFAR